MEHNNISKEAEELKASHAKEIMDENIALCHRILSGTADKEPMEFRGNHGLIADRKAEPGHGNIVYNPVKIRMK